MIASPSRSIFARTSAEPIVDEFPLVDDISDRCSSGSAASDGCGVKGPKHFAGCRIDRVEQAAGFTEEGYIARYGESSCCGLWHGDLRCDLFRGDVNRTVFAVVGYARDIICS